MFCHFCTGRTTFYRFQQCARVYAKQDFQQEISMFCDFRTGRTTFERLSTTCTSLYKTAFPAKDQYVLSFSHWAHHFSAIFSKAHEFVQNSVLSPRPPRFVIFPLDVNCLHFSAKRTSLYKAVFSARDQHVFRDF